MLDIVSLGELLIDFTLVDGKAETEMCLFEQNPGGAPVKCINCNKAKINNIEIGHKIAVLGAGFVTEAYNR